MARLVVQTILTDSKKESLKKKKENAKPFQEFILPCRKLYYNVYLLQQAFTIFLIISINLFSSFFRKSGFGELSHWFRVFHNVTRDLYYYHTYIFVSVLPALTTALCQSKNKLILIQLITMFQLKAKGLDFMTVSIFMTWTIMFKLKTFLKLKPKVLMSNLYGYPN